MTERPDDREALIISSPQSRVTFLWGHVFLAVIAGMALRLVFTLRFPAPAGDSEIYIQLARNWTDRQLYGLFVNGRLVPTDLRLPGYPAFLAGIAYLFGRSIRAIELSQAVLDLCTCFLAAGLAAALAPSATRQRVAIAGLWLAALCPFTANYSAVVLTETLVTFLSTAALLFFALGLRRQEILPSSNSPRVSATPGTLACLGAFLTGIASLVRPEMPLLGVTAGAVFALRWWKPLGARKVIASGSAMAIFFLLPLAPWAARNFITLHEFQISAPRYATMAGEYAPVGYFAWTRTWLERYRDVYSAVWNIGEEPITVDDLPVSAFDSPEEKARVAALLDQYNDSPNLDISPELDGEFAEIARERTERHPLRTYFSIPFERALTIWFTPRTELLPISAKFWPVRANWRESHVEFLTVAGLGALGFLYIALALGGIWLALGARRIAGMAALVFEKPNARGIALLVAYMLVRTAFLTTVEAPEPRYVIPCYPAVLALAALLWGRARKAAP